MIIQGAKVDNMARLSGINVCPTERVSDDIHTTWFDWAHEATRISKSFIGSESDGGNERLWRTLCANSTYPGFHKAEKDYAKSFEAFRTTYLSPRFSDHKIYPGSTTNSLRQDPSISNELLEKATGFFYGFAQASYGRRFCITG